MSAGNGAVPRFKLLDLAKSPGEIEMPDGRILPVQNPNGYAQDILMKLADAAMAIARDGERAEAMAHNDAHPDDLKPVPDELPFPDFGLGEVDDLMRILVPQFTAEDIKSLTVGHRTAIIEIARGNIAKVETLIAKAKKVQAAATAQGHESTSDTSSPPSPSTVVAPSAT